MLVVGFAFLLDSEMAAGLLYVVCVPSGGLGYLVATMHSSAEARTISATVNLISTYLVLRMIPFYVTWIYRFVGIAFTEILTNSLR